MFGDQQNEPLIQTLERTERIATDDVDQGRQPEVPAESPQSKKAGAVDPSVTPP
jgi:hypothetical protein